MISVLILTKNEASDLPICLSSLQWCDDVHVLDSFSDDKTIEIAEQYGANVTLRKFDGYATQRNFGLTKLNYKHDWIFILDADETVPQALVNEIQSALKNISASTCGFRIRRRDYLWNRWLKHAQITPFYIRLIKKNKASYHREVNEVIEVDGQIAELSEHFNHYPFSKGFTHWLNKHNVYSSMEAQRWIDETSGQFNFSIKKALFSKDFSEKRYHQKGLFYKLPFRPLMKWVYMVFFRLSFLDGAEGVIYATLQSIYEYFIVLKTKEILIKKQQIN